MASSSPKRLHTQLVHDLGVRIVGHHLAPGEPVPTEEELVSQTGASRTAVREALKVLAGKGLIASRTSAGTRVQDERRWSLLDAHVIAWRYETNPTLKQLEDLAGLRIALEPEAARVAASGDDLAAVARIAEAYVEMEATIKDLDAFIAADLRFHQTIFEASKNELLIHLHSTMSVALSAVRQVHTRSNRRNRQTLPMHKQVFHAIRDGDADQAQSVMRALVVGARTDIEKAYRPPDKATGTFGSPHALPRRKN